MLILVDFYRQPLVGTNNLTRRNRLFKDQLVFSSSYMYDHYVLHNKGNVLHTKEIHAVVMANVH